MALENRMDRITDMIKVRVSRIVGEAKKQYKGTNPYRQEPVSAKERIMTYDRLLANPEVMQALEQEVGSDAMSEHHRVMQELIRRKK